MSDLTFHIKLLAAAAVLICLLSFLSGGPTLLQTPGNTALSESGRVTAGN